MLIKINPSSVTKVTTATTRNSATIVALSIVNISSFFSFRVQIFNSLICFTFLIQSPLPFSFNPYSVWPLKYSLAPKKDTLPDTSTTSPGTKRLARILCTPRVFLRIALAISGSYSFNASIALSALRSWKDRKNQHEEPSLKMFERLKTKV